MLDELFAKLDTPLRVALVSHMAKSRMMGDSEGKRGFSELVKEWTRKCLGKKTSAESEAITLECQEKVEALEAKYETRLAHQRMLEAKVKLSAEEYDANMWLRFFLAPKYMTNCSYKHTFSPPHLIYLLNPTSSQHILTSSYH